MSARRRIAGSARAVAGRPDRGQVGDGGSPVAALSQRPGVSRSAYPFSSVSITVSQEIRMPA